MHSQFSQPEFEFLWGAEAIAKALNQPTVAVYHQLEKGRISGARKIGNRWCLHMPTFRAAFTTAVAA